MHFTADNAGRADEEHSDENDEGYREFVFGRHELGQALGLQPFRRQVNKKFPIGVGGGDFGNRNDISAGNGAKRLSDAADDSRGENRQKEL